MASKQELKCCRCRLFLPISKYSKAARKRDEPECIRCTAWACSLEYDVIPPPLESGHVSIEEMVGGNDESTAWAEEIRKLHNGIAEVDLKKLDESQVAQAPRDRLPPAASRVLPRHLVSASVSETSSVYGGPSSAGPSTTRAMSTIAAHRNELPGYLGGSGSSSRARLPGHLGGSTRTPSEATTVREARQGQATQFNSWDNQGRQHTAFKNATTVSSLTSESGRTDYSSPSTATGTSAFPTGERIRYQPKKFVPHIRSERAAAQINEDKKPTFCPSDSGSDDDYNAKDWS